MNHPRQTAGLAILGLVAIGALSWAPSSHSQMLRLHETVLAATARARFQSSAMLCEREFALTVRLLAGNAVPPRWANAVCLRKGREL